MPKIAYGSKRFKSTTLAVIEQANKIIEEYAGMGYNLTLRQLYYQFVKQNLIPNEPREYDRLGRIISDARIAGLVDWDSIVDRTRGVLRNSHWNNPQRILNTSAAQYRIDKWARQPNYIEVWIEKDALRGVIAPICKELDLPYFSCRGYVSQSEMWRAAERIRVKQDEWHNHQAIILHLGDHDPSGIDMTRDIINRLNMFDADKDREFVVDRIALNMGQIIQYNLPPNPAKSQDARFKGYKDAYGSDSWELDALTPPQLVGLIRDAVLSYRDEKLWQEALDLEDEDRRKLYAVANRWQEIKV